MDLFHGMKPLIRVLVFGSICFSILGCDIGEADPTPRGRSAPRDKAGTDKAREAVGIFSRQFSNFDSKVSHFARGLDGSYYLVVLPSEDSSSSVLMKSTNGEVWQTLSLPSRTEFGVVRGVAVDAGGNIFVIGSEVGGVFVSKDGGNTYEALDFGITSPPLFDKLVSSEDGLVIAASLSEFYVLEEQGATFSKGRWPAGWPNDSLLVFTSHGQIFTRVLNGTQQGIAGSKNKGQTFTLREASIAPHFMAKDSTGIIYALDAKGVLLSSTDKGLKFSHLGIVGSDISVIDFAVDANNWLFVLTPKQLYYSADGGKVFKALDSKLGLSLGGQETSTDTYRKMMILKDRRVLISTSNKVFISE